MSVGDRKHPLPGAVYQRQHAPGATAVGTVLARGLANAYSLAQYGGRHAGAMIQPVLLRGERDFARYWDTADQVIFGDRVYIPDHWDGITAHVVYYTEPAKHPRFRLRINAVNGDWTTPAEDPTYTVDQLVAGATDGIYEHMMTMDIPAIAVPGTFTVEVQAGDSAENPGTNDNFYTPLAVHVFGRVD